MTKSLLKTVEEFKRTTAGRHSAALGENATSQMPHPKPPVDRPHIREDAMKEVNLKRELGKSLKPLTKVYEVVPSEERSNMESESLKTNMPWDRVVSYKVGNLWHHVGERKTKHGHLYAHHVLSYDEDPHGAPIASIVGRQKNAALPFEVEESAVDPEYRDEGHGTRMYATAAAHHGAIQSDSSISEAAHRLYAGFKGRPNFHVKITEPGDPDPHVITYTGKPLAHTKLRKSAASWTLRIRGRDGNHKAHKMVSLGPTKGSAYVLDSGEVIPADQVEGVVMFDGVQDRAGPNGNTADTGFHLAKADEHWKKQPRDDKGQFAEDVHHTRDGKVLEDLDYEIAQADEIYKKLKERGLLKKNQKPLSETAATIESQTLNQIAAHGKLRNVPVPESVERLYADYKHDPHKPMAGLLKYLIHRVENLDQYHTPEGAAAADADFLKRRDHGLVLARATDRWRAAQFPIHDLHAMVAHKPHLIDDLIAHKNKIQAHLAAHPNAKVIDGHPHVALARGLGAGGRIPDPTLSSYADTHAHTLGGRVKKFHNHYVPVKNIWYSYDMGPEASHPSHRYPAQDEYLVSPHELKPALSTHVKKLVPAKPKPEKLRASEGPAHNWVMPTDHDLGNEYDWEYRHIKSHLGDIFPTKEHFMAAAKAGKIQPMPDGVERATSVPDVQGVRDMVSHYQHPRDVDRIVEGLKSRASMPAPIVVRHPHGHFMMGGNTRQNLARIHGIQPHVLVVDAPHTPSYRKSEDFSTRLRAKFGQLRPEELDKGVARKLAPYSLPEGQTEETKHSGQWVRGNRPKAREELPRHEGPVRFRAINKLFGATKHRLNPTTGDLEFLMHRGMSATEAEVHQTNSNNMRTSWTPDVRQAAAFAGNYTESGRPGQVMSAWVPVKHMHHFPFMEGHDPTFRPYRQEFEVVVAPHAMQNNIESTLGGYEAKDKYARPSPSPAGFRLTNAAKQYFGDTKAKMIREKIKQQLHVPPPTGPAGKTPKRLSKSIAAVLAKLQQSEDSRSLSGQPKAKFGLAWPESLIEVSSVAVIDPVTSTILMGRRSDTGKWTMPGGHSNPGESALVCAMRELREEAGIICRHLEYLGSEKKMCEDGKVRLIHAYVMYGRPKTTGKYDPDEEVQKWVWIPFREKLPPKIEANLHSPKNVTLKYLGLQKW